MGRPRSLVKAGYSRFPYPTGLGNDSRFLQQLFHCRGPTSLLGVGGVLVFFVGRASLDDRVLRSAQANVTLCFWA